MSTVYGQPAVEVPQPDGQSKPYLIREVPPRPQFSREWELTNCNGTVYRVSDPLIGPWVCTCKDHQFRARRPRKHKAGVWGCCKHVKAVHDEVNGAEPKG